MKNLSVLPAQPGRTKTFLALLAALGASLFSTFAAIPSCEKLLPDDTLIVVTVPDFAKMREIYQSSPQARLWNDPAMSSFKDNFLSQLKEDLVQPLERELGVHLDTYTSLPQGQLTFAITQNGWPAPDSPVPGALLLLDARDKSGQLKTNLAELKRKWVDAGKTLKTESIRNIEFTILPISEEDIPKSLKKVFPSSEDDSPADGATNKSPSELVIGQFESLLIVGNSVKAVEKVVVRLTGGSSPALGDLAAYESSRLALFRESPLYGWINVKPFVDLLTHKSSEKDSETPGPFSMFSADKIVAASGLAGLKTFAFNVQQSREGLLAQMSFGVPESGRQGLFKMFPSEAKESGPPPFVPADAVRFQRVRIDGQKAWTTLQKMLAGISPQLSDVIDFMLNTAETAAKQKDPDFDIRKSLFGNLGDDVISYEKAPSGTTPAELSSPPSLLLIGSARPDQLAEALKSLLSVLGAQGGGAPTERDFLGRKIYSLPVPTSPLQNADPAKSGRRTLHYAASARYIALTTDVSMLEEYLRSSDSPQKALRELPGLEDAISKVGGSGSGWFGYHNQAETTRVGFELLRKSSASEKAEPLAPGIPAFVPENSFKDWMDFSLLPPFEKIAKYFYFTVYSGSANVDGITFKIFTPVPPQLKK
jgi:hypothetical protein